MEEKRAAGCAKLINAPEILVMPGIYEGFRIGS
jgi:hypothetical protein